MPLNPMLTELLKKTSKISAVPILKQICPPVDHSPSHSDLVGFKAAQDLAMAGAHEIVGYLKAGWTERQAAKLLNTWLCDNGVKSFFHYAYVWFGERTRFDGISRKHYHEFMPSDRVLLENEVFILDVAPIVDGYICDIGYTSVLGEDPNLTVALDFLSTLKETIIDLFKKNPEGHVIWDTIDQLIRQEGYDNIHALYPFNVLGHRVYKTKEPVLPTGRFLNFGGQSYWNLLSRGLLGQLLNPTYSGNLLGLWAIEPHIGTATFGAKFEEILVVDDHDVYWLSDKELDK